MTSIAAQVSQFGWAVVRVSASDEGPAYAYSVGLIQSYKHPEVIVFGLALDAMQQMINNIGNDVKRGVQFEPMSTSDSVLEGYLCAFRPVAAGAIHRYMGLALQFYGREITALHCIWPDRRGQFPWEVGTSPEFRRLQPMLSDGPEPSTRERP